MDQEEPASHDQRLVAFSPVPKEGEYMRVIKRLIDVFTLGSARPVRRLVAYYIGLAVVLSLLVYASPIVDQMFSGERLAELEQAPQLLQDGLTPDPSGARAVALSARLELAISTALICFGTLALMLPVSWVYMSTKRTPGHNQSVVQALIILPLIVAGIILIVRNSLALAFSLAGVVSVLRFRTTLTDVRDIMFIFLGIAVGFAAGVQVLLVAVLLSVVFNFVLLLTWRYDFGRNVLQPTAASRWAAPLDELAQRHNGGKVPDRDLVLALTPKKAELLTERFKRVGASLGADDKKPRYNAVLTITTNQLTDSQIQVQGALDKVARRWKLDEVVTNDGKPSQLFYLVKLRKSAAPDEMLTAIRSGAGEMVQTATLEVGDAGARETLAKKNAAKDGGDG